MASAQDLINTAYGKLVLELPALDKLKLVIRLELQGRGDIQVYRVRTPGPEVDKAHPEDARLELSIPRSRFNELAEDGELTDWREALERGDLKVSGDPDVIKLLGTVIDKHMARSKLKRVR
ncbi:MAG TPA: SCP2 sterol-binding domain-containing protein [Solirubrobacterales bacterium]|nr:SCP2 sterol-binding domain-containing protein [Solirubrobacterales bacterium]